MQFLAISIFYLFLIIFNSSYFLSDNTQKKNNTLQKVKNEIAIFLFNFYFRGNKNNQSTFPTEKK